MDPRAHPTPRPKDRPSRRRRRLRRHHRRLKRLLVDGRRVLVEPGGMVEVAVRELGAVVVSVEERPASFPGAETDELPASLKLAGS